MSWLQDLPIRRKLTVVILITCTSVVILAFLVFAGFEFIKFRKAIEREMTVLADVSGLNVRASLAFQDETAAKEILRGLQSEHHILDACLYTQDGNLFAQYTRSSTSASCPSKPEQDGSRFANRNFMVYRPVTLNEKRIGTIYLRSDLQTMYDGLRLFSITALLVLLGSFVVAFAISRRLQRPISLPILGLAETARVIAEGKDYSVRAVQTGKDEIATLTGAFNQMLNGIQERESALQAANESLNESQEITRAIVDVAMDGIITMNHEGQIMEFNSSAERILGFRRDEVVGKILADVIIPVNLRDQHRRGLARYLETGEHAVLGKMIEVSGLRADGSLIPIELNITRMPGAGNPMFTGFLRDITERKQAQSRVQEQLARLELLNRISRAIGERQDLQSIFQVVIQNIEENLPVDFSSVYLYNRDTNQLTVESVGPKSGSLAMQLSMQEKSLIAIDANGLSRCLLGKLVYEPDVTHVAMPFPQKIAEGGLRSMVAAPLLVESQVFGILLVARKKAESFSSGECEFLRQVSGHVALASHQAQLHNALQQAYDDLRETQHLVLQQERLRALGQMASGIAHDINNAISPISLYTEALLEMEPNLSERTRNYLETIQRAGDDIAHTVSRMREFYRQRETQLALAPVHLNRVVDQVIDLTRARWLDIPQQRGIVFEVRKQIQENLPVIMGVESEIREALTNLIFNAVDSMPEGGTLTLRTKTANEITNGNLAAPALVQVEVSDVGIGMDEETRRRCLEPFYTTKGERGTGLGLAMVYGMIQRHSADIEIESERGIGTTVRLNFAVSAVIENSREATSIPYPINQHLRLLIIDDDPMILKSLQDTLEGDGHRITIANGGQKGIDAFHEALENGQQFDAIFTDLGMPYVDGRKVAASIRAMSPKVPLFLLTGWGQRLIAEGDIPPGVDRVLNKPPKLRELREVLVQYCHIKSS
jgi:PAS domain S-box-containing protein